MMTSTESPRIAAKSHIASGIATNRMLGPRSAAKATSQSVTPAPAARARCCAIRAARHSVAAEAHLAHPRSSAPQTIPPARMAIAASGERRTATGLPQRLINARQPNCRLVPRINPAPTVSSFSKARSVVMATKGTQRTNRVILRSPCAPRAMTAGTTRKPVSLRHAPATARIEACAAMPLRAADKASSATRESKLSGKFFHDVSTKAARGCHRAPSGDGSPGSEKRPTANRPTAGEPTRASANKKSAAQASTWLSPSTSIQASWFPHPNARHSAQNSRLVSGRQNGTFPTHVPVHHLNVSLNLGASRSP